MRPPGPGHLCVVDDPGRLPPVTGAIFTTKGHQLEAAVDQVAAAGPGILGNCWFAGLQNGVMKDEVLAAAFGHERVLGAATVLNARRTEVAQVTVGSLGMTYFGELGAPPSPRVTAACEAFGAAGLPATAVDGRPQPGVVKVRQRGRDFRRNGPDGPVDGRDDAPPPVGTGVPVATRGG